MACITGINRNELFFTSLNDFIPEDNDVRVIDALIDSLNLYNLGYSDTSNKHNSGRPHYDAKTLLKIYILGYKNAIRSGRKLEKACVFDLRFRWLTKNLFPDANTINDFRKNNKELLVKVFYEINRQYVNFNLLSLNNQSQDGFKIKASNSKDKNFTINKVIDRIEHNTKTISYLESEVNDFKKYIHDLELSETFCNIEDEIEEKKKELANLEQALSLTKQKKIEHENIYNKLQQSGESQISLTDPESKLMRNNGKFDVAYNVQGLVDMESHMTSAFTVDNNPSDLNSMHDTAEVIREEYDFDDIVTNSTDKGYNSNDDIIECLEKGVIPQVTPMNKNTKEMNLETDYEENTINEETLKSIKPQDIKKCLKAGVIPECYKDYISEIEIVDKKEEVIVDVNIEETRTPEEIRETAIKNQTFERDLNTNLVYCPQGETLSKKANRGENQIKYCNKLACKNCKNPCTKSAFKEIVFKTNQKTVIPSNCQSEKPRKIKNKTFVNKKKVKFKLKLNNDLLRKRMQTSEHTQGTMKTVDNHSYFNVRGKDMVKADLAIHFIASNLRRAINMIGSINLIEKIQGNI